MINTTLTNSSGQTANILKSVDLGNGKKLLHLGTADVDGWDVGAEFTSDSFDGVVESVTVADFASFFESRDEAQAEAELGSPWLYGWDFNHLGWKVPFENGISLYGQLIALNLNRQNLTGVNVTNTSGGNGRALSVIQNVSIQGLPSQVNGWKQSDTPTSYNIRPEFIENIDDDFLYADAYISWEEDGTVNMQTTNLQNRPANATVEVVI